VRTFADPGLVGRSTRNRAQAPVRPHSSGVAGRVRTIARLAGNRAAARYAAGALARAPATGTVADAGTAADAGTTSDADIDALDLSPVAKKAAQQLKKAHPEIVFTSGRRDVAGQAHAMAANIVSSGDRKWIEKTYASAATLQKWVDDNPNAKTVDEISAGLKGVLDAMSDADRGKVSKHLSGDAFDVQPQTKDADKIKAEMAALPGATKFLSQEGGLERWHVQF
jgi:hypothetical protein